MNSETVNTLLWAFLGSEAIFAVTIYAVLKLTLTGRSALFDRKPEDRNRLIAMGDR